MSLGNTRIICGLGLILAAAPALGQYDLSWFTLDAGGATYTTGGDFELSGTIGQADAGAVMTGGDYGLAGGFWPGASASGSIPCPGDLDSDLDIDLADLAQLLGNYGTTSGAVYEDGDIDGDGDVDLSDLAGLLGVYGTICP
jgi:hypothetical protein